MSTQPSPVVLKVNDFDFEKGQFVNIQKSAQRFSFEISIIKRLLRLVKLSYPAVLLNRFLLSKTGILELMKRFDISKKSYQWQTVGKRN